MAIDLAKIKNRLNALTSTNTKANNTWKPKPGKQVVRIVPYKYTPDIPFIELKFHYNLNEKTYLSPDSFGRPDPIVEFSNRLKKTGDKEDWKNGKKLEPKTRTYVPVIVRGEESEGIRFWGFGKQVHEELMATMLDPDFGDISDIKTGRDIQVEFKTAKETGKDFPETSIRVKPNVTEAFTAKDTAMIDAMKNQINILDLFPEPTYAELKEEFSKSLNPSSGESETSAADSLANVKSEDSTVTSPTASKSKVSTPSADDVMKSFDDLFEKS